jgi:hypothetical protein
MEDLQQEMNEKLSALMEEMQTLTATIKSVKRENEALKVQLNNQADEIAHLKNELNDRELYSRSWSVRFLNVQLPQGQESNTRVVMDSLYRQLLKPILEGALSKKEITSIPTCENLLETAHILPGKGPNKPVIARFYSRFWKGLIFQYRREFAPRESNNATNGARGGQPKPARMKYPFYEHLTATTFKQLKNIQSCQQVQSVWTVGGVIKFKLNNSETVHKVSSIFDTVESIIGD